MVFLEFLKTFSLKNKGFEVLKNENWYFIFFKEFFVEEQMIWSSKKRKMVFLDFYFFKRLFH